MPPRYRYITRTLGAPLHRDRRLISNAVAVLAPRGPLLHPLHPLLHSVCAVRADPHRIQNRLFSRTMKESEIKRNPHPDFKSVESARPDWDRTTTFHYTKTAQPTWTPGSGANDLPTTTTTDGGKGEGEGKGKGKDAKHQHITIDPYAEGRAPVHNYKLLISAVIPRPIAFVSTRSADGQTTNLAPFSYFQLINHDPPLFIIGFASGLGAAAAASKHSLHNLHATGECTINIISEHFVEAANATSVNAPLGVSEWAVSGLTPAYDCETVQPARVKEAVFSIEGKLESVREFESRSKPGKMSGTMAVVEGTRFWVREDAINEERNIIDPAVRFLFVFTPFRPPPPSPSGDVCTHGSGCAIC